MVDQEGYLASGKTEMTGFLHLSNEVRNRIYEYALFDHDRTAVFLPRALPRKVTVNGERIIDMFWVNRYDTEDEFDRELSLLGLSSIHVHHDCHWNDGGYLPEEVPLPIYTESLTDDESEGGDEEEISCDPFTGPAQSPANWHFMTEPQRAMSAFRQTRNTVFSFESMLDALDTCQTCGTTDCACDELKASMVENNDHGSDGASSAGCQRQNPEVSSSTSSKQDSSDYEAGGLDENGFLIPPLACTDGRCKLENHDCSFCGGFGVSLNQADEDDTEVRGSDFSDEYDNDAYASSDDDLMEEDAEHLDSQERMGLLFDETEPDILLVCKEIREQCLPMYYGRNAFSWRFFWLDQKSSFDRFTKWTQVVGKYAMHITKLSFEGRHSIEEGIEFEADIDLLKEPPFYNLEVQYHEPTPGANTTSIDDMAEKIQEKILTLLWKMSKRDEGAITYSCEDLQKLGRVFVDAMQSWIYSDG